MVSYIGIVSLLGVQPSKNETTPRQTHVSAPLQVLSPKLEGIVWDAESPLAIVGGKPLKTGQSVDGWLIESIGMDRVRIARDGATQVLVLPATETKK